MKELEKLHNAINNKAKDISLISRIINNMKKYFYIGGIAGVGLLFNGCFPGYVSTQPTYTETYRSESPSNVHIWVDGNWHYNHSTQTYVHSDGYWTKSNHGRKFVPGHWKSTPKGHRWVNGHWTR